MILHSLTLEGVGPYADRQTLEFGRDPRRPVTLIGGLNGAGKTTLMRSLFHAMYGARSLSELGQHRSYAAFLDDSVHSGREDATLELTVTIPGLRDHEELTLRRHWRNAERTAAEDLDVYVAGAYDEELSERWDETIEQIAPLGIARLFFFDGEKIEALADLESAASSLRVAVGSLLGLDLVEQLRVDLLAVQRRALRATDTTSSAALEKRQSEFAAADELAAQARRRAEELECALVAAQGDHNKLREAMSAAGGDLIEQREAIAADSEKARATEAGVWDELRDLAGEPLGPLTLVPELLEGLAATALAYEQFHSEHQVVEILEDRDAWLISELKRHGVKSHDTFAGLLDADRKHRARHAKEQAAFEPRSSLAAIREVSGERLTDWRAQALQIINALDEASGITDGLDRRLSRIPSPDSVRLLISAVDESEQRVDALTDQLQEQEQVVTAMETHVTRARDRRDAELERLAELEDGHERQQRVTRHAERAKATLGLLRTRVAGRHVGRIADYTMQCLAQLLRKDRLIEGIEIDPETFALTLQGAHGSNLRPESLSAGERQLTALALLWALARAAGRPLPVVIDTPLGRLDADHRRHVVERYLPAASHQVIVLSTDTEIDADLHGLLAPTIGAQRQLLTDDEGRTTIVDGYLEVSPA